MILTIQITSVICLPEEKRVLIDIIKNELEVF